MDERCGAEPLRQTENGNEKPGKFGTYSDPSLFPELTLGDKCTLEDRRRDRQRHPATEQCEEPTRLRKVQKLGEQ
ncbi:hypothetical protein RvVAR031_pl06230 (plasmid) [Agrobacterium vitis]|nr:hypothetical protein RvVAR031_pl06230 [Agrobacterium vitis]